MEAEKILQALYDSEINMKEDERIFLAKLQKEGRATLPDGTIREGKSPREIISMLPIHPKRARYILSKWTGPNRDWYEYGVCIDLGCLTPKGMQVPIR